MMLTLHALLLPFLAALPLCPPQASPTPATESPSASSEHSQRQSVQSLTQADLNAIRDRVLPLVEKQAGRKFKAIPKVELAHNSILGRILHDEFAAQFELQFPTLTKAELKRFSSSMAGQTALAVLGKFDTQSKVLYIVPVMFDILVKSGQISKKHELDLLTIIVAHELTHALQDASFPLREKLASIPDQAGMHAYNGCIEGHATHVQDLVAKELGIEAAAKEYHLLLVGKQVKVRNDFVSRYKRSVSHFYYSLGAQFFAALEKKGGKKAVWKLLEEPPARSGYLFGSSVVTEKVASAARATPQLFAELAKHLTKRPRQIMASTADQTMLRCLLVSAKPDQVDEILNPLRQAWFVQVGSYPRMGVVLGMKFADVQSAKRFFDVAPNMINQELDASTDYSALLGTDFKYNGVRLRDSELGMDRTDLTYTYRKGKFGQVKGEIRWYLEGNHVIQIDISNMRTKSDQLDKMAKRALALMTKK